MKFCLGTAVALQVKVADSPRSVTGITTRVADARPKRKQHKNVDFSMGNQMMAMELGIQG